MEDSSRGIAPSAWVAIAGALFSMFATSGCVSSVDGARGLPPFYESLDSPVKDGGDEADTESSWVLRPFLHHRQAGEEKEFSVLWPLIRSQRSPGRELDWLLPLAYRRVREEQGQRDIDTVVFPFFFWGDDTVEGPYFLFFPVIGRLKGILGQDRTDWFLFPLYLRAADAERKSHHVLWPFFNWIDAPHRDGGRFLPFYGRYTATTPDGRPKYDRRFYLWPFFHVHDNNLDTDRPSHAWWFFPFYGKIESENLVRFSVLWPFYTFVRKKNRDQEDTTTVAVPFPFPIIFTRGPDQEQSDFWPFYGVKRSRRATGTSYRQYFLWPIQRYQYSSLEREVIENYWFLPLYWSHRRRDLEHGTESSQTRLWPLYTHRRETDGTEKRYILDLLPFTDGKHFEPQYARIWRLFRHVDLGAEGSRWDAFWGLLQGGKQREGSSFSLFGGLLSRESRDGDMRWRILYIPF